MSRIFRTGVARRVMPLVVAALIGLGAFIVLGVFARGATAQPPSSGNGAARFDDLRELNNKLAREIATLDAQHPDNLDDGQVRRTLKDLEVTKLRAVGQFQDVFGLPFSETFTKLSCIDERIAVSRHLLVELDTATGGLFGASKLFFVRYTHRVITRLLKEAKACKDTLEVELGGGKSVPAAVTDDLRELNNKLAREIATLDAQHPDNLDEGQVRRALKDLEVTKLRAVDGFPEILDPIPYSSVFVNLSCIDERIAVSRHLLVELDTATGGLFGASKLFFVRYTHRVITRLLKEAKACKDTLEVALMHPFDLKPSEQTEVGVNATTPNGTDTQNPNKLNAPKTLEHAYVKDGFVGRHEQDYLANGVNGSNPESWPAGRNVLFFDVFDLFGSARGAQKADKASIGNLHLHGYMPIRDSSLGPGEAAFQKQSGSLLGTIIYVQRGTFIMKIAGACNDCQQGSVENSLKAEAQTQLNRAVLMGFPGPAPSGPGGSGTGGSGTGGSGGTGGTSQTASGSLTNGSGTILNYSIQTNTASNAFELILPSGDDTSQVSPPSGFNCSDSGHIEFCTGNVMPNSPLIGSFDHTGAIAANCGCVQVAFSQDAGAHWSSPATLSGPPTSSPPPNSAFSCTGTRSSSDSYTWTVDITCNQPFSYVQLAGGAFNDRASNIYYSCPPGWGGQASSTSNTITFSTTTSPAPANTATQFQAMWSIGFTESGLSATASPNSNGSGAVPITFIN